jgi:hypothetical protein
MLELVDGKRTVEEIANRFNAASPTSTIAAFRRYFEQGLLVWRT